MAKFDVVDMSGKKVSTVELSDAVFGITPNEKAVHEAVVNFLANQRQGTQNTKIRKEVRGGGKKPWRQKGTGHARQGSIRAPQWTHGGVALGPKPRDYSYTINKKVKRLALLSALSDKAANGNLIVVDKIAADEFKTKTVVAFLAAVGAGKKNLILNDTVDVKFVASAANIPGVKTAVDGVNTYDVVNADKLIVSLDAAKKLEGGICVMKFARDIVLAPVITENSMAGIADKKYTFKVATNATKVEIAQAVEELFGVKVAKVNTISVRGRYRRQGMHAGYTATSKKAIVTLKPDSKEIEFFNSMV